LASLEVTELTCKDVSILKNACGSTAGAQKAFHRVTVLTYENDTHTPSDYFGAFHQRHCARTLNLRWRCATFAFRPSAEDAQTLFVDNHLRDAAKRSTRPATTASAVHVFCLKSESGTTPARPSRGSVR
jgi:hypothetical protein